MKLLHILCFAALTCVVSGFFKAGLNEWIEKGRNALARIGEERGNKFHEIVSGIFNAEDKVPDEGDVDIESEHAEDNTEEDVMESLRENFELSQGDMIIPKAGANDRVGDLNLKWSNKVMYYAFGDSQAKSSDFKRTVRAALDDIEKCTCLRFKERSNERNYVKIIRGQGCYSYVGEVGGAQELSLGNGCEPKGIIIHEFLHALGMEHQHSRPDRDEHVEIHLEHVDANQRHNFNKVSSNRWTTLGLAYDFNSLMHYGSHDFSTDGSPTVVTKHGKRFIGQRQGLSAMDIKFLNKFYECGSAYESNEQCTTKALSCKDTEEEWKCKQFKQRKDNGTPLCESKYASYLNTICPATCGHCAEGGDSGSNPAPEPVATCENKASDANCSNWAGRGYCKKTYVNYMTTNCAKACNKC